ncbi:MULTISPECIES: ribbon-helix-helix domain-containing protein [Methylorubrum]|jgi:hypothetical protein|uniref:Uncharacterized protein n=3 Tax=Methylorubrum TaxID=2282523 RepID=A0A177I3D0_9HYPH|nr:MULTISPECIES: ribbon-helix-helix domain-containing protein [Methylorubrum]ACB81729.1 conserved hypothetical protein [Methylorubrum populi BJ001]KAB7783559.1 hypothetical protein F8B43_3482 [Methylorubrum populi]MBA8914310.1 hypothetical protein [Methylorubrum thiocyanatum]OAH22635.1 hypothetical protein AX289_05945 [Methylorubrum populi]PZP67721.1 MAG: hypothetical protein DI590_19955 [Methylorubrum populi]
MSRPPKLDLASIVASAGPAGGARKGGARSAARANPPTGAEIVRLDVSAPAPRAATLKERAKQMSVYLEPPVYDQLRDLAYAERTKMHALMLEALDLLFKQRGARSIEQVLGENAR